MAGATPQLIKELREMTGAGMLDCKNALNETDGDLEKAVQALREAGLGKAAKKAGNIAAEGVIAVKVNADNTVATMLELNAQTDFVAKNENFLKLTQEILSHAQANNIVDAEALASSTISGTSFSDFLNGKIATIGENLNIRRFARFESEGLVEKYINMLKMGGSKKSLDILKTVGIDLEDSRTYENALKFYKNDIEKLEELI